MAGRWRAKWNRKICSCHNLFVLFVGCVSASMCTCVCLCRAQFVHHLAFYILSAFFFECLGGAFICENAENNDFLFAFAPTTCSFLHFSSLFLSLSHHIIRNKNSVLYFIRNIFRFFKWCFFETMAYKPIQNNN